MLRRELRLFLLTLAALAGSLGPHLGILPLWIILWCVGFWSLAALQARGATIPLKQLALPLVTLAGVGLAAVSQWDEPPITLGAACLAVLLGLKPLEMRSHRDRMVAVFLSLFLTISGVFRSESLFNTLYLAAMAVLYLGVMMQLTRRRGVRRLAAGSAEAAVTAQRVTLRASLGLSARLVLAALPLAVALFLVFPRIPYGLLGFAAGSGGIGFDDAMAPGDITELALSETLAFRVRFEDQTPAQMLLYWRTQTLERAEGMAWRRSTPRRGDLPNLEGEGASYDVMLEPRMDKALPLLETPVSLRGVVGFRLERLTDATAQLREATADVLTYTGTSRFEPFRALTSLELRTNLALPGADNPRARALGASWRDAPLLERVRNALTYIREEPFFYTLTPTALPAADDVDAFLFETREGFCEHYAAAFAFLMRAAGTPARVVRGYQGGDLNRFDDYIMVRQLHAHAWTEVYNPSVGWVRVDPIAAVAPERIERGARAFLDAREQTVGGLGALLGRYEGLRELYTSVTLYLDMIQFRWQAWVVSYDYSAQLRFFQQLGVNFGSVWGRLVTLFGVAALVAALLVLSKWWMRRRPRRPDKARRCYARMERVLQAIGAPRSPAEAPLAYAERVAAMRPDLADSVREITELYLQARYGPSTARTGDNHDSALDRLEARTRTFTTRRASDPTPSLPQG